MKVYVVGEDGPEHNSIESIHCTYEGALKAWNKLRLNLLESAPAFLKKNDTGKDDMGKDMWQRIVTNLSCDDPQKIDNYPHETPYIQEYEVKE